MKQFATFRIYQRIFLPVFLSVFGASMIGATFSGLLRYHEASERYREHVDPIMDRMIQTNPTPQNVDERIDLISDLQSLRFQMSGSHVLEHATLLFFGGFGLFTFGFALAVKNQPKARARPESNPSPGPSGTHAP